jgi:two-component system phosphate regulon response regulator PhoB
MKRIMVIDDENSAVDLMTDSLRAAGYAVVSSTNGPDAIKRMGASQPDLILLDWLLPEMSGIDVCKALKSDPVTQRIPIIMVSAKSDPVDRIVGFEIGVDDYISKPFSPRELTLRVQSILRRSNEKSRITERLQVGDIVLDRPRHMVRVKGSHVELTSLEFKLLALLMERKGKVQTRENLLNEVWAYDSLIDSRTVDTHVRRLREKLGKAASAIETVRGVGYKLID